MIIGETGGSAVPRTTALQSGGSPLQPSSGRSRARDASGHDFVAPALDVLGATAALASAALHTDSVGPREVLRILVRQQTVGIIQRRHQRVKVMSGRIVLAVVPSCNRPACARDQVGELERGVVH
ncbi:hypothetical protein C4J65_35815 [Streptomyces sp. CB09001]|nr:hypothetical protein C4J65_35815 [Streptomyces sp. CB09001]